MYLYCCDVDWNEEDQGMRREAYKVRTVMLSGERSSTLEAEEEEEEEEAAGMTQATTARARASRHPDTICTAGKVLKGCFCRIFAKGKV